MSTSQQQPFEDRVRRLERKHQRMMTSGATPKLEKDGLIVMRPRRSLGLRLSPKPFVLLALLAFGFKIATYSALGPEEYQARLAGLDTEQPLGMAGAFVMQPDPATLWVHQMIGRLGG